jgi:hypothetical protein
MSSGLIPKQLFFMVGCLQYRSKQIKPIPTRSYCHGALIYSESAMTAKSAGICLGERSLDFLLMATENKGLDTLAEKI